MERCRILQRAIWYRVHQWGSNIGGTWLTIMVKSHVIWLTKKKNIFCRASKITTFERNSSALKMPGTRWKNSKIVNNFKIKWWVIGCPHWQRELKSSSFVICQSPEGVWGQKIMGFIFWQIFVLHRQLGWFWTTSEI